MIKRLSIREGMFSSSFSFSGGLNLIQSNGVNTVGKTTLIRCLIYALGEETASTTEFQFSDLALRLELQTAMGNMVCIREGKRYRVVTEDGTVEPFVLPENVHMLRKRIWGIQSEQVGESILGSIFIDQDKGWTLLNRGRVTAGAGFDIEMLVDGLAGDRVLPVSRQIQALTDKIKRYKTVADVAGVSAELAKSEPGLSAPDFEATEKELEALKIERAAEKRELARVRNAQKQNEQFVEYVSNLRLRLKLPDGTEVPLTKDNLADYGDCSDYLEAQATNITAKIYELERDIKKFESAQLGTELLFQSPDAIEAAERQIALLHLEGQRYADAKEQLTKQKNNLAKSKKDALKHSGVYYRLTDIIRAYCEKLGIGTLFSDLKGGIFTSDLKGLSGAQRQLLVFAFRLGYVRVVKEYAGVSLPFIVDSPKSGEFSTENYNRMIKLLADERADSQTIVASISGIGIEASHTITIETRLTEHRKQSTDIREWEERG